MRAGTESLRNETDRPRRRRLRAAWLLLYLLYLLLLVEVGSRAYWRFEAGVPFFDTGRLLELLYYPELTPVLEADIRRGDDTFDILLLGGSVLADDYGGAAAKLEKDLERRTERPVRVHNLAVAGHTSRDSYWKYTRLGGKRFDLVVLYHGINEVRANNCPPGIFRADYGHYLWYREVNQLASHPEVGWLVSPFTIERMWMKLRYAWEPDQYVPRNVPREEWLKHGSDLRSPAALETNFRAVLELARERGDRVLLMTFAFDPTPQDGIFPPSIWGHEANVVAGIRAHNRVIRTLAAERAGDDLLFVDQARLMPPDDPLFVDICHLSRRGLRRFVNTVGRRVARDMRRTGDGAR